MLMTVMLLSACIIKLKHRYNLKSKSKYLLIIILTLSIKCEHDGAFLIAVTSVLYMLFWLWSTFYQVYFETIVELSGLKASRPLSSQHYSFWATQDSQGVALPQLWLHNSHALNCAPDFKISIHSSYNNCTNFMVVNLYLSFFCL